MGSRHGIFKLDPCRAGRGACERIAFGRIKILTFQGYYVGKLPMGN